MKSLRDGSGVVFDIQESWIEGFIDNFDQLKKTNSRIDFEVTRCKMMPDIEDFGGNYGGSKRRDGNDFNGRGSGGGYGGRGSGFDSNDYNSFGSKGHRGSSGYNGGGGGGYSGGYSGGNSGFNGGTNSWNKEGSYSNGLGRESFKKQPRYMDGGNSYYESNYGGSTTYSRNEHQTPMKTYNDFDDQPKSRPPQVHPSAVTNSVVFIGNIQYQATEQDVMDFLNGFNLRPLRARFLHDQEGNPKGACFVQMACIEDAARCIEVANRQSFMGRQLLVNEARKVPSQSY